MDQGSKLEIVIGVFMLGQGIPDIKRPLFAQDCSCTLKKTVERRMFTADGDMTPVERLEIPALAIGAYV